MEDACAAQEQPASGECRCKASSSDNSTNASSHSKLDWGLPTPSCNAQWTHYFTNIYPQKHAEWRAQGRVVVHCSASSGLGNYLRSLPSALIYSMITEQALTLACDDPKGMYGILMEKIGVWPSTMPGHLARFFHGPHFNWSFPHRLPYGVPHIDLEQLQMKPWSWPMNASKGSRVTTKFDIPARRLLLFSRRMKYFTENFGHPAGKGHIVDDKTQNLEGCLLRYLLAPRPVLQSAVHSATGMHATADGLMPTVAMHVRMGDSSFAHGGSKTNRWYAAAEVHRSPFDASPRSAFACLERLSSGGQALGKRSPSSMVSSGSCLGCVVVSDSERVEQCARHALPAVVITPGVPVHLAASSANLTDDPLNVQRIFLDWFLLASSSATLLMQEFSSYSGTAFSYKAAAVAGLSTDHLQSKWPHIILSASGDPNRKGGFKGGHYDGAEAERWWQERCSPHAPPSAWWAAHVWGYVRSKSNVTHNGTTTRTSS